VDLEQQGQGQVVTCSGALNTLCASCGTESASTSTVKNREYLRPGLSHCSTSPFLRCYSTVHLPSPVSPEVLTSSPGVCDGPMQTTVELLGIKGMWSLRRSTAGAHDAYLVVTFIRETRILGINADHRRWKEVVDRDSTPRPSRCTARRGDTTIVQVSCPTEATGNTWPPILSQ